MINLTPISAKKKVALEYWIRITSVGLILLSGVIIIATILLSPVYVLLSAQTETYSESASSAAGIVSEYETSSATLIQAGVQAGMILKLKKQPKFTDLVELLQTLQNPDISIESFSLARSETDLKPHTITGKARTRQSLANFRETLIKHEAIETAFLPISNLAQDKDISFTVTITMKKDL